MRCRARDLVGLATGDGERRGDESSRRPKGKGAVRRPDASPVDPELMLLGKRIEEALVELDRYLDRALLSGSDEVRVVLRSFASPIEP